MTEQWQVWIYHHTGIGLTIQVYTSEMTELWQVWIYHHTGIGLTV